MTDLLLTEAGDLELVDGDLALDMGLGSAVLRSIFTDGRATSAELARAGGADPRGWWGSDEGDAWGSVLWLFRREAATEDTRKRVERAARGAVEWLIEDGIASSVDVVATYPTPGHLSLEVVVHRGEATRWASTWESPTPALLERDRTTLSVRFEG